MPTATLTYNLPDEQDDFDAARTGRKAISSLREIDQTCRTSLKYGNPDPDVARLLQQIRDLIPGELLEI